jgi:hypothetical protein
MNISTILIAATLVLAGLIYGFGVNFNYDNLIVGLLAISAAVFLCLRK